MKILSVIIIILLSTGCTSMQKSVYSNESTPYENKVYATGPAAVEAAGSSYTYNCPSCSVSGQQMNRQFQQNRYEKKSEIDKIYESSKRTLSREISNSINDVIRGAFQ